MRKKYTKFGTCLVCCNKPCDCLSKNLKDYKPDVLDILLNKPDTLMPRMFSFTEVRELMKKFVEKEEVDYFNENWEEFIRLGRIDIMKVGIGVSQWKIMGQKFGYWKYFEDEVKKKYLDWIESDEFYDMLPGNGIDDWVCDNMSKKVKEFFNKKIV